jgi:hypothetical protein
MARTVVSSNTGRSRVSPIAGQTTRPTRIRAHRATHTHHARSALCASHGSVRSVRAAPRLSRPSTGRDTLLFQKRMRRRRGGLGLGSQARIPSRAPTTACPWRLSARPAGVARRCRNTVRERNRHVLHSPHAHHSAGEPSPSPPCQRVHSRQERPPRNGGHQRRRQTSSIPEESINGGRRDAQPDMQAVPAKPSIASRTKRPG